jgi:hypothetical protein
LKIEPFVSRCKARGRGLYSHAARRPSDLCRSRALPSPRLQRQQPADRRLELGRPRCLARPQQGRGE